MHTGDDFWYKYHCKNVRKDKKFLFENLFSNKFDQFIIGVNYL